jgi:pyrimidine-nucleoside phosphorylase
MLVLAGVVVDREAGRSAAEEALASRRALEKLLSMVRAQGGDERCIQQPELLPRAPLRQELSSPADGVVARADARTVAEAVLVLGAGRERKGDSIDHAVGVVLAAKIGDRVTRGQPLAVLHGSDQTRLENAARVLAGAFEVVDAPIAPPPLIHWRSA